MKLLLFLALIFPISLSGQLTFSKTYNPENKNINGQFLQVYDSKLCVISGSGCFNANQIYNCANILDISLDGTLLDVTFIDNFSFGPNLEPYFNGSGHLVTSGVPSIERDTCRIQVYDSNKNLISEIKAPKQDKYEVMVNRSVSEIGNKYLMTNNARESSDGSVIDPLYVIDNQTGEIDTILEFKSNDNLDYLFDAQLDHDGRIVALHLAYDEVVPGEELFIVKIDTTDYTKDIIELPTTVTRNLNKSLTILQNGNYIYHQFSEFAHRNTIHCVDNSGSPIWEYTLLGSGTITEDISDVTLAKNGDILINGYKRLLYPTNWIEDFEYEVNCGWLMRLSPNGDLIWSHYYPDFYKTSPWLTSRLSTLNDIVELDDGSIVSIGTVNNYDENDVFTVSDLWLLKVSSDGCLEPNPCENEMQEIGYVVSSTTDFQELNENLPTTQVFSDRIDLPFSVAYLFNISGQIVLESSDKNYLDVNHLPNGIYFLHYQSESNWNTTKIVIQH